MNETPNAFGRSGRGRRRRPTPPVSPEAGPSPGATDPARRASDPASDPTSRARGPTSRAHDAALPDTPRVNDAPRRNDRGAPRPNDRNAPRTNDRNAPRTN